MEIYEAPPYIRFHLESSASARPFSFILITSTNQSWRWCSVHDGCHRTWKHTRTRSKTWFNCVFICSCSWFGDFGETDEVFPQPFAPVVWAFQPPSLQTWARPGSMVSLCWISRVCPLLKVPDGVFMCVCARAAAILDVTTSTWCTCVSVQLSQNVKSEV